MNPLVILLVLLSALLHVAWNILGKSGTPSKAFFFVASFGSVLVLLPFLIVTDFNFTIIRDIWFYLLFSGFFMSIYYSGLSGAYRTGEMSMVYPLARALPVLFVPFISVVIGNIEGISFFPLLGMVIVFTGCLILPQLDIRRFSFAGYFKTYSLYAVLAAFGTTGYTLLDSMGMEIIKTSDTKPVFGAIYYFIFQMIFTSLFLGTNILFSRLEKEQLLKILRTEKIHTIFAGVLVATAYIIILICYPLVIHVSYVTAFRQISIPMGALAGIFLLKEKWSIPKVSGVLIIFTGLLIVYLF
jgi:drug/metabolite transporter (DMT)-like permease